MSTNPARDLLGHPILPRPRSKHPLYAVWQNMRQRCGNPRSPRFPRYGGRGITICDEWSSLDTFMAWALTHGWQPGLHIGRRNVDLGYSPANCRFTTNKVNNGNRGDVVKLADGRLAREVAATNGISVSTFNSRYQRLGWTPAQAAGIAPPSPSRRNVPRPVALLPDGRSGAQVAAANGVPRSTFSNRLRLGWTPAEASGEVAPPPRFGRGGKRRAGVHC